MSFRPELDRNAERRPSTCPPPMAVFTPSCRAQKHTQLHRRVAVVAIDQFFGDRFGVRQPTPDDRFLIFPVAPGNIAGHGQMRVEQHFFGFAAHFPGIVGH